MGGRPRYARRGRTHSYDDEEFETYEPFKHDYTVYDDEPRFVDTGLVFPDGEPIYRENGAPMGFPITSDREDDRE
jgi:hypothetical protein